MHALRASGCVFIPRGELGQAEELVESILALMGVRGLKATQP